jgi:hypothetical protein
LELRVEDAPGDEFGLLVWLLVTERLLGVKDVEALMVAVARLVSLTMEDRVLSDIETEAALAPEDLLTVLETAVVEPPLRVLVAIEIDLDDRVVVNWGVVGQLNPSAAPVAIDHRHQHPFAQL